MKFKPGARTGEVVVELEKGEASLPAPAGQPAVLPEFKIDRILVPLDFSECSKKALQYALPFARQFDACLYLLHVLAPYIVVPEMPMPETESQEDAERDLRKAQTTIAAPVRSHLVVRRGLPHVEIIHAAKELDVDMIVISTHGRTGLAHVLVGSTAEKVIRHSNCPVLVVREHEHEFVETD